MRLGILLAVVLVLAGCGPAPNQTELRTSTPAMAAVCAFRSDAATKRAQEHCALNGANARWNRKIQECRMNDGEANTYTFLTGIYPDVFAFDCVR
jgi:hypothetical protein